jgi:outer membrane beta-barrel protein
MNTPYACKGAALMRRLGMTVAFVAVLVMLCPPSEARVDPLDGQPTIRQKQLYLKGRHTVTPSFGVTLANTYSNTVSVGVGWRYFVASWLGVGVDLGVGLGVDTSVTTQINEELSTEGKPFQLSTSSLRLTAAAMFEIIPFAGKFKLGAKAHGRIDVHLNVGFGMALIGGSGRIATGTSILPVAGAGIRFFPDRWIAIGIDVRNLMVKRVVSSLKDGSLPAPSWGSNWQLGISVGFFFPTELETRR